MRSAEDDEEPALLPHQRLCYRTACANIALEGEGIRWCAKHDPLNRDPTVFGPPAFDRELPQAASRDSGRKGDWMQTYTNKQFWPLDPRPEEVSIEDIAHALSHVCRYGGHSKFHYSVAQHSYHASIMVTLHLPDSGPAERQVLLDLCLQALLHDAAEAYIGDMIRPIKRHMPEFRAVEDKILKAVGERFGVELVDLPQEVKDADERMLATEVLVLRGPPPAPWALRAKPYDGLTIPQTTPADVKRAFLDRFFELGGKE